LKSLWMRQPQMNWERQKLQSKYRLRLLAAGMAALAASVSALHASAADPLPAAINNAGSMQEERARERERLQARKKALQQTQAQPSTEAPQAVEDDANAPHFELQGVRFTKTQQLSREELTALVKPWLKKSVSLKDIYALVAEINQLYRRKNIYTSIALLPQQTIKDGQVIIQLVEGELGELLVEGNRWSDPQWIARWVQPESAEGVASLDMKALESDILLFNRLHEQFLQAQLRSGKAFGKTDILVTVNDPERNTYQLWSDNYGFESSGEEELGGLFQRYKLFTQSDKAMAYTTFTEGAQSLALDYSSGLGLSRLRLGGNLSYTESDVISGPYVDAEVASESLQYGFYANYLLWSAQTAWVDVRASASQSQTQTNLVGEALSDNLINRYSLAPSLTWIGKSWRLGASYTYTQAQLDDQLVASGDRDISLNYLTLSGLWRPAASVYLLASIEQQSADETAIPGALAFNLGGVSSIRGLKTAALSGDEGQFYQTEIHYDGLRLWSQVIDISLFYDQGNLTSSDKDFDVNAAGLGVSIYGQSGLSFDVSAAQLLDTQYEGQASTQVYGRLAWRW
jgi:hemolysin activation/secretion protein